MLDALKQEANAQWEKFRSLSWLRKLAVVGLALLLIAVPCWHAWQNARKSELRVLYVSAYSGNLESVKKLSSYKLSGGTTWLERLARDRDADAYAPVAAIDQLTGSCSLNSRGLVPLLWIDVPFVVRHESAHLFATRGCDDDCIRMSLDSLHAMWAGRPPLEAQLAPKITHCRKMMTLFSGCVPPPRRITCGS